VQEYGWLDERQFLIAVAVGMISPGPLVITATFVGYLVAGFWGSLVATIGIFLPSFHFLDWDVRQFLFGLDRARAATLQIDNPKQVPSGTSGDTCRGGPKSSPQETLAYMIGTTRSRVSFFMNKFRKLGFITYNGSIEVHSSFVESHPPRGAAYRDLNVRILRARRHVNTICGPLYIDMGNLI
jgi:Chromate transporter